MNKKEEISDKKANEKQKNNLLQFVIENEKPVSNLIDKINDTIEQASNLLLSHKKHSSKFSLGMAVILTLLISLIIIVSGLLTLYDKMDGAALTFLFGLLIGYMLTFIREAIYPKE